MHTVEIDSSDSGNAYHDRARHLRTAGGEARGGMTQNSQIHKNAVREGGSQALPNPAVPGAAPEIKVALLTGGSDRPYVWGLTTELMSKGVGLDLIGSDELAFPEFRNRPKLNFLNLRGDQRSDVGAIQKIIRISA
jgi:hypothetical protein